MAYDFPGTGSSGPGGSSTGALVYQNQTHYRSITAFTVAGWVNVDEWGDGVVWATREWSGGNRGFFFWVDAVGFQTGRTSTVTWALSNANGGDIQLEGATDALSTSAGWQHVAASFEADDPNGARLYIDGVEDANSPVSTVGIIDSGTDPRLAAIGDEAQATNARSLNGQLAEIATWNRVLSPDEIAALAKGFSPLCFPSAMFDYWPLVGDTNAWITGETATVYGTVTKSDHPPIYRPQAAHIGMPAAQMMELSSAFAARHAAAVAPDTSMLAQLPLNVAPAMATPGQIGVRGQTTLQVGPRVNAAGTALVEANTTLAYNFEAAAIGGFLIDLAAALAVGTDAAAGFGRAVEAQIDLPVVPAMANLAMLDLAPEMTVAAVQILGGAAELVYQEQVALATTLGEAVAGAIANPGQLVTIKALNQTIAVEVGEDTADGGQIIRIDSI